MTGEGGKLILAGHAAGTVTTWRTSAGPGSLSLTATGRFVTYWRTPNVTTATVQTLAIPKQHRSAYTLIGDIVALTNTNLTLTNVQRIES
jgi:hypothetical protein